MQIKNNLSMYRSEKLIEIRPNIELEKIASYDVEKFQNLTLRPLLKFQNEIYLLFLNNYLLEVKIDLAKLSIDEQYDAIENGIKNNLQLKNTLIGCSIGIMTEEEMKYYLKHKTELNRRIINMVLERVKSQLEKQSDTAWSPLLAPPEFDEGEEPHVLTVKNGDGQIFLRFLQRKGDAA